MKSIFFISIVFPICLCAQPNHPVISQAYGGGGNSGAVYTNDFIELFNPTSQPFDLSGYSVQYSSSAGTSWNAVVLNGVIQPGKYFLVQLAGGTNGIALPPADQAATINLSASSGKIALLHSVAPLSGNCPPAAVTIDFLGYGAANCFETLAAPGGSNTISVKRKTAGCTDTDNNSQDFFTGTPMPRNSSSGASDCSALNSNLPVYFTNEELRLRNGKLQLSWTNQVESGVEEYVIEYSVHGLMFEAIESIAALKNDGTSVDYEFPLPGANSGLYRIRAIESNGMETFSKVLKASENNNIPGVSVFPNPFYNNITVQTGRMEKGIFEVFVTDMAGRIMNKIVIDHPGGVIQVKPDTYKLEPGTYILLIKFQGSVLGRVPLIKML